MNSDVLIKHLRGEIKCLSSEINEANDLRRLELEASAKRISSVKADRTVMKKKLRTAERSRDKQKEKGVAVLKAVIALREDGLLNMKDYEIAIRFFVCEGHIKNLTHIARKERI